MVYLDPILMDFLSSGDNTSEMPQITLTFKELLIKATFHNNYELVCELLEWDEFDESIIHDIGLLDVPFPLYYITMCYKRTMWEDFIEETMPFVEKQRIDIDKLLQLWKERFGAHVDEVIDYKKYEEYFYCLSDEETTEDVFMDSIELFQENGCRQIDLDLFEAVDKFQFSRVRDLLEKGANPNANLVPTNGDEDDPFNCLDRISSECSYLCTCQIFSHIKKPHGAWYINYALTEREIGDLIGWAAHEDMYHLLEQYDK